MPQCSDTAKEPFISYTVVAFSIGFMPLAMLSLVIIISCIIKKPYEGFKTPLNALVVSFSVASLFSVPVNGIRGWYHAWNATGVNPHIAFPSLKPMIHFCHIFWFWSQFCSAFLTVLSLSFVIWKDSPSLASRSHQQAKAKVVFSVTAMIWVVSFLLGLGSTWTGMNNMQITQVAINITIIIVDIYLCCVILLASKNIQIHAESTNNSDENYNKQSGSQKNWEEGACNTTTPTKSIQTQNNPGTTLEDITEKLDEDISNEIQYAYHQALAFAIFSMFSGAMFFYNKFEDFISCSAMYWVNDVGKLGLQAFLAINPIITMRYNPKIKKSVVDMLKFTSHNQPDNP